LLIKKESKVPEEKLHITTSMVRSLITELEFVKKHYDVEVTIEWGDLVYDKEQVTLTSAFRLEIKGVL
jgi:hypothetical protein